MEARAHPRETLMNDTLFVALGVGLYLALVALLSLFDERGLDRRR